MAAKKRKSIGSTAKKAVKKPAARTQKKVAASSKTRKLASKAVKSTRGAKLAKTSKKDMVKVKRAPSVSNVSKAFTKGQLFSTLADCTGVARKDVAGVFDELSTIIGAHLKKQGPGQFTLPGLLKISIKHKPATKARKGINPFTGEETMFKAKPARNVVKAKPLQRLKAMA